METIIETLEGTPWWVYLIFIYVLIMGVKALKPRTVSIKKLIILPAALTIWGLAGRHWDLSFLLAWALSLCVGLALGWILVRRWKVRYERKRNRLHLPGTWTTLVLALLFFTAKYFFGYYQATHDKISLAMNLTQAAVSGCITGVFIGRLVYFWKTYEEI